MPPDSPMVRVFERLARLLLPRSYRDEIGVAQLRALRDAAAHRARHTTVAGLRFWIREFTGLLKLAIREFATSSGSGSRRRPPGWKTGFQLLHHLRTDLLYALRMVRKAPLVSGIAVTSIALGVAGVTTGFAVLHAWLLRPLPYPDSDRLVMVYAAHRTGEPTQAPVTVAEYFDWREQSTSFDRWIAQDVETVNITGTEQPVQADAALVTPSFFDVLGADPLIGRTFLLGEGAPDAAAVAVISERLWRNRFGADPQVLGRPIYLDGTSHTVVGILGDTFDFLYGNIDVWVASTLEDRRTERSSRRLLVTAHLRDHVSFDQAQSEMAALSERAGAAFPDTHRDWRVNLEPVRDQFPSRTDASLARIMMVVTTLMLLVACANVAGVLLAKTESRHREFALRAALGAGRPRIVQQLLTESVFLAVIAGVLGAALVYVLLPLIGTAIPDIIPRMFAPRFDLPVATFTLLVSVMAGVTFGISPAAHLVGGDRLGVLSDATRRDNVTPARRRLGSALVVGELALALTILIGAGALGDVFGRALRIDPGYNPRDILTVELAVPEHRYAEHANVTAHLQTINRQLSGVTSVSAVTFASHLPRTTNLPSTPVSIDGVSQDSADAARVSWLSVGQGYFELLGIPVQAGRTFSLSDRADGPGVAVVNERFVDRHLDGAAALGHRLVIEGGHWEIIGVVPDVAQTRMAGLQPTEPTVYFSLSQQPRRLVRALLRTDGAPMILAATVQATIWEVDPEQPVAQVRTLEDFITQQLAGPQFLGRFVAAIGIVTLCLAALGIYGIVAFNVSRLTGEIGVRMALGARPFQVLARVARRGGALIGLGLLIGTPAAIAVARAVMAMPMGDIPGMTGQVTLNPGTVLGTGAVLIGVAVIACLIPAHQAARVDPASALRET